MGGLPGWSTEPSGSVPKLTEGVDSSRHAAAAAGTVTCASTGPLSTGDAAGGAEAGGDGGGGGRGPGPPGLPGARATPRKAVFAPATASGVQSDCGPVSTSLTTL